MFIKLNFFTLNICNVKLTQNVVVFLDKLDFSDSEQSEDSDAEEIHPQTQTETGKSTYTYIKSVKSA